jgi:hypothetical protein
MQALPLLFLSIFPQISHAAENPSEVTVPPALAAPQNSEVPAFPAAGPVPWPTPVATAATPPYRPGVIVQTADAVHDGIEQNILQQAIWLDNFFGKPRTDKELAAGYLLRLRGDIRYQLDGGQKLQFDVRLNLTLPKIDERLRLIVSGENEADQITPRLPEDPGNPGFDRTFQNSTRIVNTELRYGLIRTPSTDFFLGAGIGFVYPPNVFARGRYQYTRRLSEVTLARFAETLFVKTPAGVGETTEFGLEHSLGPKYLLRWSAAGTVSEEIHALEWGTELALFHEISSRKVVAFGGGIYGNTGFDDWVRNYRLFASFRSNLFRNWLFYELEPQVFWPRQLGGNLPPTYVFTARLEIVFQKKERRHNR